ncbi:MAG: hypothetical protein ACLR3R_08540 [Clostridium paraputrificum]
MGKKKVRCFRYNLKLENNKVENCNLKNIINEIFIVDENSTRELNNGNKVRILKGEDIENYLSIELINKLERKNNDDIIEREIIDERFLFFRVGREKDIEGAIKRNLETWEGSEVIDLNQQDSYNIEICTYILIDTDKGIVLELFGKYAPNIKILKYLFNELITTSENTRLNGIQFDYNNIMSNDLINSLKNNGTRLGQMTYNYENPNLDILLQLGFTPQQISSLKELDVFQLEINLKGKTRTPLSTTPDVIRHVLNKFTNAPMAIKNKLMFKGSTESTTSKNYTFKEEEVTYNIDIPYDRKTDSGRRKLNLDEIAFEAYTRLYNLYNENINDIESYIGN